MATDNDDDLTDVIVDTAVNTCDKPNEKTPLLASGGQASGKYSNGRGSRDNLPMKESFSFKVITLQVLMFTLTEWPWETVSKTVKFIMDASTNADLKKTQVVALQDMGNNADDKGQSLATDTGDIKDQSFTTDTQSPATENKQSQEQPAITPEQTVNPPQEKQQQPSSTRCSIKWIIWTSLRLLFIIGGIALQVTTCFRRDLVSTDLAQIPNTNTKRLSCDKRNEVICAFLIPDCVVFLVALWVYVGLKFGYECCKWLGWKELSTVTKADTAVILNKLVEAVKFKLSMGLLVQYSIFPLAYIILSQGVSIGYLIVFQLWDEDVVIQTPFGQHDLDVKSKCWLLGSTFIGFIALDLLYVAVIMRYVYRCQIIIYYLQMIRHKVKGIKHSNRKEAMEEVKKAKKFIRYLNASSGTTGFITIIAVFQAVNCTILLLSDEITYPEAGVITARLILFGFLAIYPFYKAAGLNDTAERIHDTGLDMCIDSPYQGSNKDVRITLKATMFGILVQPWLPYLVLFVILLTTMVGSKLKWYEIKL